MSGLDRTLDDAALNQFTSLSAGDRIYVLGTVGGVRLDGFMNWSDLINFITTNVAAGGSLTFLGLTDTPAAYPAAGSLLISTGSAVSSLAKGSALQVLRVNAAGTGLEFAAPAVPAGGGFSDISQITAASSIAAIWPPHNALFGGSVLPLTNLDTFTQIIGTNIAEKAGGGAFDVSALTDGCFNATITLVGAYTPNTSEFISIGVRFQSPSSPANGVNFTADTFGYIEQQPAAGRIVCTLEGEFDTGTAIADGYTDVYVHTSVFNALGSAGTTLPINFNSARFCLRKRTA